MIPGGADSNSLMTALMDNWFSIEECEDLDTSNESYMSSSDEEEPDQSR